MTSPDLEAQRLDLVAKVQGIDLDLTRRRENLEQLAERIARSDPFSYKEARREYERWRSGALTARQHALDELRQVKAMVKEANIENQENERDRLRRAIARHRQLTYDGGYEPTGVDLELWDEVDRLFQS